jgi:hypothetical protein
MACKRLNFIAKIFKYKQMDEIRMLGVVEIVVDIILIG